MELLSFTTNPFGGVLTETELLPGDPEVFRARLGHSLDAWRGEGYRLVWVEIPLSLASLVPVAAEAGFTYHHSGETYVMMTLRLEEAAFIPAHASHYIGAGGVVLSEDQELLVVSEKYQRQQPGPPRYKLPGGALHEGEHLAEGVVREVLEETGVRIDEGSVRYLKSQPWPFPQSCMVAFRATADCDQELVLDDELLEAKWWDRSAVRKACAVPGAVMSPDVAKEALEKDPSLELLVPPKKVVARELIEAWLSET